MKFERTELPDVVRVVPEPIAISGTLNERPA
jgi:hypothetical protein